MQTTSSSSLETGRTGGLNWLRRGSPTEVVLLHGFSDSSECWVPVLDALTQNVLAIDARGHGGSELPPGELGPATQADDVAAVLDALGTGPVVVVGHSMGASTGAALAGRRPDLVSRLVLEDPPGGGTPASTARPFADWIAEVRALSVEDGAALCARQSPQWPVAERLPWARSKHALDLGVFDRPRPETPTLAEQLALVTCPTLLLRGEPGAGSILSDDVVAAAVAAATCPLDVVQVPGAGHNVRRDRREDYLRIVTDWLVTAGSTRDGAD